MIAFLDDHAHALILVLFLAIILIDYRITHGTESGR